MSDNRTSAPRSLLSALFWVVVISLAVNVLWSLADRSSTAADDPSSRQNKSRVEEPTPVTSKEPVPNQFRRFPHSGSDIHSLNMNRGGDLLLTAKYGITEIPKGHHDQARDISPDLPAAALSFGRSIAGYGVWAGTWSGEIITRTDGQWAVVGKPCHGQVKGIDLVAGALLVLCDGLLWNQTETGFERFPGLSDIESFGQDQDWGLWAGTGKGLLHRSAGNWELLVSTESRVTSMTAVDGWLLVGTDGGAFRLDPVTGNTETLLDEGRVRSFAPLPDGSIWIGTWGQGLRLWKDGRILKFGYTQGLPEDNVIGQLLSADGEILWVALYGQLIYQDARSALTRVLEQRPDADLSGMAFDSACIAAGNLLGESPVSGQVARDTVEGVEVVFFNGRQICPNPDLSTAFLAFRRADGRVAYALENGEIVIEGEASRRVISGNRENRRIAHLLLDHRDQIWTAGGERLNRYNGDAWDSLGHQVTGMVTVLEEDQGGHVWVGSHPRYDSEAGAYEGPNVARFGTTGITYYDPDQGIPYWSTRDIVSVPGGVAVATNGGVALIIGQHVQSKGRAGSALAATNAEAIWSAGEGVWVMRGNGIQHLDSRNGLFSDRIRGIALDGQDRVWLVDDSKGVAIYPKSRLLTVSSDR